MLKVLAIVALVATTAVAQAKTFKLGGDQAVAEIAIPDGWDVDASEGTVEATAPDETAYVSAEMFDATDLVEAGRATAQFLKDQKIQVTPGSKAQAKRTVAGFETQDMAWEATDEDGPTHFRISLIKVRPDRVLLLTYWRSDAGEKAHGGEVDAIEKSIKPIR